MNTAIRCMGVVATGFVTAMGCSSGLPNVSPDSGAASSKGSGNSSMPESSTVSSSSSTAGSSGTALDAASESGDGAANAGTDAATVDGGRDATPSAGDGGTDAGPLSGDSGALAGCVTNVWGAYVLRSDGVLLYESGTQQQPILDSATGAPLGGVLSVEDLGNSACAVVANSDASIGGRAECWQILPNINFDGQLGNGTTTNNTTTFRATPVLASANTPLTNVASMMTSPPIDGSTNTACAIATTGELWCWGDLTWVIGKGTSTMSGYAEPITVDGTTHLTGVIQAAASLLSVCAIVGGSPNTLWCWGSNAYDELNQGDTATRQYPVQVPGFANPSRVALDLGTNVGSTVCVLDGASVNCWGYNGNGVAGVNSTTSPILSPTPVVTSANATLSGVVDLEPGSDSAAVLRSDGTLWQWGAVGNPGSPYAITYGLTNIVAIGAADIGDGLTPRFLTNDGTYHEAMTSVAVNCNPL